MNAASLVRLLTLASLIAVMLSMGLRVRLEEIVASLRQPLLILFALVANFVLVPAVTVALLYAFNPHPMVAAGFLILAVCPGAPLGPPFAAVAKGDVAYATGLMVVLAGLSAVLSPILLGLLLARLASANELQIDYLTIVTTLLVSQLLPLGLGLGIHRWLPLLSRRIVKPLNTAANVLLLSVIVLILIREHDSLKTILLSGWLRMSLLLVATLFTGGSAPDRICQGESHWLSLPPSGMRQWLW
jgi:BASS family bile acid:Na+ symporter